jgi:hypothetical protein
VPVNASPWSRTSRKQLLSTCGWTPRQRSAFLLSDWKARRAAILMILQSDEADIGLLRQNASYRLFPRLAWFALNLPFCGCLLHFSHLLRERDNHFNHATVAVLGRLEPVCSVLERRCDHAALSDFKGPKSFWSFAIHADNRCYALQPCAHINNRNHPRRDAAESVACSIHSFNYCFTHQGQTGAQADCPSKRFFTTFCRRHFAHLQNIVRTAMQIATYDAICHVHPQGICNICVYIRVQSKIASMINPFFTPSRHHASEILSDVQQVLVKLYKITNAINT